MGYRSFKELNAWRVAIDLTLQVHRLTKKFPQEEQFGLVSQMRRSARSVASNIAEGQGRATARDFVRYLDIAVGGACELESDLVICRMIGYISEEEEEAHLQTLIHTRTLILRLKQSLKKTPQYVREETSEDYQVLDGTPNDLTAQTIRTTEFPEHPEHPERPER